MDASVHNVPARKTSHECHQVRAVDTSLCFELRPARLTDQRSLAIEADMSKSRIPKCEPRADTLQRRACAHLALQMCTRAGISGPSHCFVCWFSVTEQNLIAKLRLAGCCDPKPAPRLANLDKLLQSCRIGRATAGEASTSMRYGTGCRCLLSSLLELFKCHCSQGVSA